MADYSIAEAKDRLAAIVDEALSGERVTITRDGAPIVELWPTGAAVRSGSPASAIDQIEKRALKLPRLGRDVTDLIREMRDERP